MLLPTLPEPREVLDRRAVGLTERLGPRGLAGGEPAPDEVERAHVARLGRRLRLRAQRLEVLDAAVLGAG
eukprot:6971109-Lingulodinium_polyedra.AAC.1